jgi:hypothetical protein
MEVISSRFMRHPNTARQLLPHETRIKPLTPRVKLAARLYATGAAKTKRQAAEMAGLSPSVFYITSTTEPQVSDLILEIDREMAAEHVNMAKLLEKAGRRAVRNVFKLMETSNDEKIQLAAAKDLADRSPETSKVTKVDLSVSVPISQDQFEAMRKAMLESANLAQQFPTAASGNFVTAGDASTARGLELVKDHSQPALPAPSMAEEVG